MIFKYGPFLIRPFIMVYATLKVKKMFAFVGFEVFIAMVRKNSIFWDITLCNLLLYFPPDFTVVSC
jgi:hypothetical protein